MSKGYRQGAWAAGLGIAALLAAALTAGSVWAAEAQEIKGHQVFFRGGAAIMDSNRAGEVFTDVNSGLGRNDGGQGYYVGGGLDQMMHKNFLGIKGMSLMGEVGLEFKRLTSKTVTSSGPALTAGTSRAKVQLTMLTIDVAPKLKFREGQKLRPWIIPIGLDFHVISPPSNQANYLDIGVQWGAGIEYNIFGPFNLGIDGRYHLAANMTNTVNNFGTVGAYLGILY